jgi:16S rRNA (guanine527-N7)-methyltransferase
VELKHEADALGLSLNESQLAQFAAFSLILQEWSQRFNLTRITSGEEIKSKHFLDSLSVAVVFNSPPRSLRVLDVGSGAGFPGIPLQIAFPDWNVTLLEATGKKVHFLEYVKEQLALYRMNIIPERAEAVAHTESYRETFELVTSRAVAPLATLVELTLPFCRLGGVLVAPKKGDLHLEIAAAGRAIELLGGQLREIRPFTMAHLSDQRQLVIIDKIKSTPSHYPRAAGIPHKKPLR